MAKLFERLICTRLSNGLEERESLHPDQYGFREGRSTVGAIERVLGLAREANGDNPRRFAALVTLDVRNAFNSVPWREVDVALAEKGTEGWIRRMVRDYLDCRTLEVGEAEKLEMTCGVPQGSVLGPVLWNVFYDGVMRQRLPRNVKVIAYADDLAMVVTGRTRTDVEEAGNRAVARIEGWMEGKLLKIAPQKTEIGILAGRNTLREVKMKIGNATIRSQESVKYLGVDIGRNMGFKGHLERSATSAEAYLKSLGGLLPKRGGAREKSRRMMCSVAFSKLLYAAPAWGHLAIRQNHRRRLEKVQRQADIRTSGAYRTASTRALQVVASSVPIHLLMKERSYEAGENKEESRRNRRKGTIGKWQEEWEAEEGTACWTKELIGDIGNWIGRKHGCVGYHLTQVLTGHGCFRSYLKRMKLDEEEWCWYCGAKDTARHTVFVCTRWDEERKAANETCGRELTPNNIIEMMLEDEEKWDKVNGMIGKIMKQKEEDERERRKNRN